MSKLLLVMLFALVLAMDNPVYKPSDAASRAESLVGTSRSEYVCNQVMNYAYYGEKNYGGYDATTYLGFGTGATTFRPGCAVVGLDGEHVGMVSNDMCFIHSSSSRYQVIKVALTQLTYIFPNGYTIRCY